MELNNTERADLRREMLGSFTREELDIFLQDRLDVELRIIVDVEGSDELVFQNFIRWAGRRGELTKFLQAVSAAPNLPRLQAIAATLLAKAQSASAPGGNGNAKPFTVSGRLVIDRDPLWQRVTALGGPGSNRVLVVNGGVGKSHSVWLLSYLCDPSFGAARLVWVDTSDADVPITPGSLAKLLAVRLWDGTSGAGPDPFAQDARDSKGLASWLINRLSGLSKPTWLVLDELDLVNLEPESLELLARLSKAVDAGQCPNVWLFLVGLDPNRLGAQVAHFVPVDLVTRPARTDIESYITWFARSVNSGEPPARLAAAVDELDAVLQPTPSYADWEAFHDRLRDKCGRLAKGIPL